MSTEILLANVYSNSNAGDGALFFESIHQLQKNFPGCQITVAMDDPDQSFNNVRIVGSIFTWVKSANETGRTSWRLKNLFLLPFSSLIPVLSYRLFGKPIFIFTPAKLREIIRPYLNADLVVSKPGGFLYSSGSGLVFVLVVYTLALAWLAGKPFYIYPQSFGPLKRRWEGWLLCWILGKARIVMARETASLQLLQSIHFRHPRLYLLPDIAFAFRSATRAASESWLRDHGIEIPSKRPLLGLTAINWGAQNPDFKRQDEYEDSCAQAIRYFIQKYHGTVILFPQVTGPAEDSDDRIPARRIVEKLLDLSEAILLVEQTLPPDLMKALYGQMDIFIGTRMHSNIFALSEGIPVVAIGYMHKTRGIASMLKLDQWVVDIRDINPQILTEKLALLWQQREILRTQIAANLPALIEQAARPGSLCSEDFLNLSRVKNSG